MASKSMAFGSISSRTRLTPGSALEPPGYLTRFFFRTNTSAFSEATCQESPEENLDMVAKLKRTSVVISIGGSPDDHHEALHTTVKHDSATQDIYLEMERRRSVVLFHNSALKSAFKAERQSCMGADLSTRSTSSRSSSSRVSDPTRMRRSEAPSADEDTSLHEQGSPLVGDCVPGLACLPRSAGVSQGCPGRHHPAPISDLSCC